MPISFINEATATATTLTYPTGIQANDYIVYIGYKTSTTAPSLPTGFTNIVSASGDSNSIRACYKVAAGTESGNTSATFTSATQIYVAVYRDVTGIGASTSHDTTTSPASIAALTLSNTNGYSWVVGFSGSKQGTSQSTPGTLTNRGELKNSTTSMIDGYDTNGGVASWSAASVTLGSSTDSYTVSIELEHANQPPAAPTLSSPANGATGVSVTPNLQWSDTDDESNTISYEVQVDTVNTFSSALNSLSVVQSAAVAYNGSGTPSVAFGSNNTQHNSIVVCMYNDDNKQAEGNPTDSNSNTYTMVVNQLDSQGSNGLNVWIANNIASGANTVQFTGVNPGDDAAFTITEISGMTTSSPLTLDLISANKAFQSSNPITSNSISITYPTELLLGLGVDNDSAPATSWTVGSGWSNLEFAGATTFAGIATQWKNVTSTGSYSTTMTNGNATPFASAYTLGFFSGGPLLDAKSASGGTDAADFSDLTHGGDTDPFPSGDSIQLAVPASVLSNNTLYYWRVRGIDPTGSNTYGSWSAIDDFTTTTGGGVTYISALSSLGVG